MRRFHSILLILLLAAPLAARDLYVDNLAGDNLNRGTSKTNLGDREGPVRTISAALKKADYGDRIIIANTGQPYHECLTVQGPRNSGSERRPFVIEGNGAMLDGSAPVPDDAWRFVGNNVYRFQPERSGTQQLLPNNEPARQLPRFSANWGTPTLLPGEWCLSGGEIHFGVDKFRTPASYDLRYGRHPVGITLYDVSHVVIRDLDVRGFQLDGVNAHDNAMDCVLIQLRSEANGRSGISIGGASRLRVMSCQASNNGETQLRTEGWATARVQESQLNSARTPAWIRQPVDGFGGGRLFIDGLEQFGFQSPVPGRPSSDDPSADPFADDNEL